MTQADEVWRLRVYVGEDDRAPGGKMLYQAIVDLLLREGCSGATLFQGFAGYGSGGKVRADPLDDVAPCLPIVVEVIDSAERLTRLRPHLEQVVQNSMITIEPVQVWKYSHSTSLRPLPENVHVAQIMQSDVTHVLPDAPLADVVRLLLDQGDIKALPVVDQSGLVTGIITDGDLLQRGNIPLRLSVLETLDSDGLGDLMARLHTSPKKACDVMTAPAITLAENSSVRTAARLMVDKHLKRLPVVDTEGKLVGIVGRPDILKLVAHSTPSVSERATPKSGPAPRTARDIMIPAADVMRVPITIPIADLLDQLIASALRRAIVTDASGRILGVVTDADLVARVSPQARVGIIKALAGLVGARERQNQTAADVMTRDVHMVAPDAPISEVVRQMVAYKVKFLPVADASRILLGVVRRADLLRAVSE